MRRHAKGAVARSTVLFGRLHREARTETQTRRRARRFARAGLFPVLLAAVAMALPAAATADDCPNAAFRTGAASGLPDCRAYEVVTPFDKFQDTSFGDQGMSSWVPADGNRILYYGASELLPNGEVGPMVTSRGAGGWESLPVAPLQDPNVADYSYLNGNAGPVTPDLSALTVAARPGGALNFRNLPVKLWTVRPGLSETLLSTTPGNLFGNYPPSIVGASDDLSHVFYLENFGERDPASAEPPAIGAASGATVLYEWANGQKRMVGTKPDGSSLSPCGAVLGNDLEGGHNGFKNTVSADGSRVFFRSPPPGTCSEASLLYLREGSADPRLISTPEAGVSDPNGHQDAYYAGASADGEVVFFATREQLTADDSPGQIENGTLHGLDLYMYDVESEDLKLVTKATDGTANAELQYALVSDDGSTVYVMLKHPMIPGTGIEGEPNLYRYDVATEAWAFITTLAQDDAGHISTWGDNYHGYSAVSNWYTTSSGRYFVFNSYLDLLGGGERLNGAQLYRFDALNGELNCVSCVPGVTPSGNADWDYSHSAIVRSRTNRPITDDGQRVFFDTPDALVPADANVKRDVYEWHAGVVNLISGGTDFWDSTVIGPSSDGRDVFFSTHQQLLPQDEDGFSDIYDARIGGGFAPASGGPLCSTSSCSAEASPPLKLAVPASPGVRGKGNVARHRRKRAKLRIIAPGIAEQARAARIGVLRLRLRTSQGGRLTAKAKARIDGASRRAGHGTRRVGHAGSVVLPVRLNARARAVLNRQEELNLSITVSMSGAAHAKKTIHVSLRRSR